MKIKVINRKGEVIDTVNAKTRIKVMWKGKQYFLQHTGGRGPSKIYPYGKPKTQSNK